jgi:type IV secretory pathway TraG/TraD family ATPase VirD4
MLDPRLLLALDEAGNVAALADLPELATTGRGQGIQILSVWHDEAQLRRRYGEAAPTVVNGHRAKLFLSGLADVGALESGSKLIGDEALVELNPSLDQYGRRSYGQSTTWRPLVAPDELRRLHKPVKVRLRPWFERREQVRLQRGQWRALRARERAERRAGKAATAVEAHAGRLLGDSQREAHDGRG